ncbi:hypothetical protein BC834DRAFT_896161 [Gloeopeniophorella convolvens]|nr:hypothetical protein BC834DRAFT_896161 [Gloeopeniophorella convolvens]
MAAALWSLPASHCTHLPSMHADEIVGRYPQLFRWRTPFCFRSALLKYSSWPARRLASFGQRMRRAGAPCSESTRPPSHPTSRTHSTRYRLDPQEIHFPRDAGTARYRRHRRGPDQLGPLLIDNWPQNYTMCTTPPHVARMPSASFSKRSPCM